MVSLLVPCLLCAMSSTGLPSLPSCAPDPSCGVQGRLCQAPHGAWGIRILPAARLSGSPRPQTFGTTGELFTFYRAQSPAVQAGGLWIAVPAAARQSPAARQLLDKLQAMGQREAIPMFFSAPSTPLRRWQRQDVMP